MKLTNHTALIKAGIETRFGPGWPGTRCLAKTRRGTLCQNPAIGGRTRCKLHGGKSTGPKSIEGKARVVAANTKHGLRSKAHTDELRQIRADLKRVTRDLRRAGLIP
jgi:hypothetical protein